MIASPIPFTDHDRVKIRQMTNTGPVIASSRLVVFGANPDWPSVPAGVLALLPARAARIPDAPPKALMPHFTAVASRLGSAGAPAAAGPAATAAPGGAGALTTTSGLWPTLWLRVAGCIRLANSSGR